MPLVPLIRVASQVTGNTTEAPSFMLWTVAKDANSAFSNERNSSPRFSIPSEIKNDPNPSLYRYKERAQPPSLPAFIPSSSDPPPETEQPDNNNKFVLLKDEEKSTKNVVVLRTQKRKNLRTTSAALDTILDMSSDSCAYSDSGSSTESAASKEGPQLEVSKPSTSSPIHPPGEESRLEDPFGLDAEEQEEGEIRAVEQGKPANTGLPNFAKLHFPEFSKKDEKLLTTRIALSLSSEPGHYGKSRPTWASIPGTGASISPGAGCPSPPMRCSSSLPNSTTPPPSACSIPEDLARLSRPWRTLNKETIQCFGP